MINNNNNNNNNNEIIMIGYVNENRYIQKSKRVKKQTFDIDL